MPKRIAVHTVVVQREGQRKEILPGTLFDPYRRMDAAA